MQDEETDQQRERRLQAHQCPECRGVEPPQCQELEGERHDRHQQRQAQPDEDHVRGHSRHHERPNRRGRHQGGHRHGHPQTLQPTHPVAGPLSQPGCRPPSTPPRPARTPPRPTSMRPCHGCVSATTPTAASAGHTQRPRPRPLTTATPSGPRNSSALAVPIGIRANAAMNNMLIRAVTMPSSTQIPNVVRVNAARPRAHHHQEQHPGPGQAQPRGAFGPDPVDQPHRDRKAELGAGHRPHGEGGPQPRRM